MNGKDLFELKTVRDYSGSEADEYAQMLATIFFNIGFALFPLLEQAEKEGKKLDVVFPNDGVLYDEITVSNIVLINK